MIQVQNKTIISRLSRRTLRSNRTRNLIAVAAIALTTILFTALFTIAVSLNHSIQESNFRQCGGWNHGTFKYLTEEQFHDLRDDPLIKQWGVRRILGMPEKAPFNKSHVEIGFEDANESRFTYCEPEEGRLPKEGTNEAATDTGVLELLGVTPKIGAQFSITFPVDGQEITRTFVLCGWWTYDEATPGHNVLIPESLVNKVLNELGVTPPGRDGMTATWNLDVLLNSSMHISQDLEKILENNGYRGDSSKDGGELIPFGVNWGYTGAQLSDSMDPATVIGIASMLLLIVFTGYLIIYNVFQISVTNDIRFYGLLKTIGTTPKQLRRIIRQQAMTLSLCGIPLGLVLGWLIGARLTPEIIRQLNGVYSDTISLNPLIFVVSALFALITVVLSCRKPGKKAARVSPIEAVRYAEGENLKKRYRKSEKGVSLPGMARANLGRSRGKTAVTVVSLSLAVVLLSLTVMFTGGFDMEKYLSRFVSTDFVLSNADYFQSRVIFSSETEVPQEAIDAVNAECSVTGGCIYGTDATSGFTQEFVSEDTYRAKYDFWYDEEVLDKLVAREERSADGKLPISSSLLGMDSFGLNHVTVLDGDLSKLYEPGTNAIAAVYCEDDYGNPEMDSHWAKVGDTITLRYVDEFEYVDPKTFEPVDTASSDLFAKSTSYHEQTYSVVALVTVPSSLDYPYSGNDAFLLNSETFCTDTGSDSVMLYAFDTADEDFAKMDTFLSQFTQTKNPALDYKSRSTYVSQFENFRSMFVLIGSVLSFIVGLVGVLNFFNAVLTGIITRRREFAVLQSVGMTGRQLKSMLICEGLYYALGAIVLSLVLTLALGPLAARALEKMFWFFSYHLSIVPIAILAPLFALLGISLPLLSYRLIARQTVVERLRQVE